MFFSPPPAVTAELFTRLPDHHRTRKPTAWANANRGGEAIDSFLEGPFSTARAGSTSPTSRTAASSGSRRTGPGTSSPSMTAGRTG